MRIICILFSHIFIFISSIFATLLNNTSDITPAFAENKTAIVFTFDNNYAIPAAVAIYSLSINSSDNNKYDIWILDTNISEKNRKIILAQKKSNIRIRFFNITKFAETYKDMLGYKNPKLEKRFSIAAFYRLFIPELFNKYSRAIYLDCDIIVNADIAPMYSIDLHNNSIAAARDRMEAGPIGYYIKINANKWRDYFNSGVIIFDIKKCNNRKILPLTAQIIQNNDNLKFPDQDVLNKIFIDDVEILDNTWNCVYKNRNFLNVDIIHFAYANKPWHYKSSYHKIWWSYAQACPFFKEIEKFSSFRRAYTVLHAIKSAIVKGLYVIIDLIE